MVEVLIIVDSKIALEDKILLERFVHKIDNWTICNTACSNFRLKTTF